MRFSFTDEQKLFRDSVREALRATHGASTLRAAWAGNWAPAERAWAQLAELGVISMTAGDPVGLNMGMVDLALILEEAGRAAFALPLSDTTAVALPLLEALGDERALRYRNDAAAGKLRISVADGSAPDPRAPRADLCLLVSDHEIRAIEDTAPYEDQRSVDHSRKLKRIAPGPPTWANETLLCRQARDRAVFAAAAELLGLGTTMLEMTVDYAKIRTQFGRPIGTFQAVKHRLADAKVELEFARPLVYRAAHSIDTEDEQTTLHVSMAKSVASDAARAVGEAAVQVHGAIGYSFENDLHLYMKRAWALERLWGTATEHRALIEERIL